MSNWEDVMRKTRSSSLGGPRGSSGRSMWPDAPSGWNADQTSVRGSDGTSGTGAAVLLVGFGAPVVYALIARFATSMASTAGQGDCGLLACSARQSMEWAAFLGAPFVVFSTWAIAAISLCLTPKSSRIAAAVAILFVEAIIVGGLALLLLASGPT